MICPRCKSKSIYIKETAPGTNNEIYRRRRCAECDTKFRTVETVIETTDEETNKLYVAAVRKRSGLAILHNTER